MNFLSEVDQICQANGLLLRPVYSTAVLSPPLTITNPQIDELIGILRKGLETAWARWTPNQNQDQTTGRKSSWNAPMPWLTTRNAASVDMGS